MPTRLKIAADGSVRIPPEILQKAGWKSGGFVEVTEEAGALRVAPVEVDLFAEAQKTPSPEDFDRILEEQRKSRAKAFEAFEEKIRNPGDIEPRPEDRPDHWR